MGADRDERKGIKKGIDADDCRKNRAQQKVELRKAKRDEGLQKRRNMQEIMIVPNSPADVSDPDVEVAATDASTSNETSIANAPFETLTQICLGFVARNGPAEEYADSLVAVRALRKKLSMARNPPIDDCINANLVPAFVTMLGHPESKLQFEAAWCLTNIASGNSKQCEAVINANGVPPLVALMGSPSLDVCEQAVWAIGNIAGDCAELRDLVLQCGALERVLAMIEATASMGQMAPLRNAVWALSNLMRGKPQPALHSVTVATPTLSKLLLIQDDEVLMDTCWALSYVTDGGDDRIDLAAVQHGVVGPLMAILRDRLDNKLRTPALRTLCNILTGSAAATQAVIDAGILDVLPESIKSTKAQTRKEACWAISNSNAAPSLLLPHLFFLWNPICAVQPCHHRNPPKILTVFLPSCVINAELQSRLAQQLKCSVSSTHRCLRPSSSGSTTTSTRSRRRRPGWSPTSFTASRLSLMRTTPRARRRSSSLVPSLRWSRCSKSTTLRCRS